MRPDGGAPADTRTMGIVHSALRRDLERTRVALTTAPYPDGARRRAIGDHLLAMLHFLHVHHHGEDAGLWPMVQRKDPSTVPLLERMERDHEQIAPAISALEEAADALRQRCAGPGAAALRAGRPDRGAPPPPRARGDRGHARGLGHPHPA